MRTQTTWSVSIMYPAEIDTHLANTLPQSEDDDEDGDEDEDDEEGEEDIQSSLNNISFGALAKAQASLGNPKRSSSSNTSKPTTSSSSQLDDIRARIREAREKKAKEDSGSTKDKDKKKKDKEEKKEKRSSKHAPAVQSTKHAVSRKRQVVELPNAPKARDPRFDPAVLSRSAGTTRRSSAAMNKAYAFLDEYRASELKELKEQLAKTKDPEQKEKLERAVRSMTDRQRALEDKKREREILAEHKRREKQLIKEGKKSKPWFLKKSDLKREVLVKKYESMGSRERAKALERKRKKVAAKERKEMPWGRRTLEGDAGASASTAGGGKKRKRGGD